MERKNIDYVFRYIIAITAGVLLFLRLGSVAAVASSLLGAAAPLIYGVFIAYMVDAPASLIRRKLFTQRPFCSLSIKARNTLSIVAAYLLFIGLAAFLLLVFIPGVLRSVYDFAMHLPQLLQSVSEFLSAFLGGAKSRDAGITSAVSSFLTQRLNEALALFGGGAALAVSSIWQSVCTVFFGLVFSVYVLICRERIRSLGSKLLFLLFNEPLRTTAVRLLTKFHTTFRRYIFGQMTDAAILGSLCFLGMLVLGLPYAGGVSLVIAVMSLIPVAGTFIGVGVSTLVLLTGNPWDSLVFLIFILILQQVENNLIYPKIVGDALGIDGMFVFAGVVVGAGLMGVKGMVLGVPVTAFIYSLLSDFFSMRSRKRGDIKN